MEDIHSKHGIWEFVDAFVVVNVTFLVWKFTTPHSREVLILIFEDKCNAPDFDPRHYA